MKLTQEDIQKYGTKKEQQLLEMSTHPGPEGIVKKTFVDWIMRTVKNNPDALSDEFIEMYDEWDWEVHTPSWSKCPQLVLGTVGQDAEGHGAEATDFLTPDQIEELETSIKTNLYKAYPPELLKNKWRARKNLWDDFKIIGYEHYEWNEDKWGEDL